MGDPRLLSGLLRLRTTRHSNSAGVTIEGPHAGRVGSSGKACPAPRVGVLLSRRPPQEAGGEGPALRSEFSGNHPSARVSTAPTVQAGAYAVGCRTPAGNYRGDPPRSRYSGSWGRIRTASWQPLTCKVPVRRTLLLPDGAPTRGGPRGAVPSGKGQGASPAEQGGALRACTPMSLTQIPGGRECE